MKRSIVALSVLAFAALLFAQCKKGEQTEVYNAGFYRPSAIGTLILYVDGSRVGEPPFFAAPPSCGSGFNEDVSPLFYKLQSGEHVIEGKNEKGVVVTSGTLTITESTLKTSGNIGGMYTQRTGDCVMVGVYE